LPQKTGDLWHEVGCLGLLLLGWGALFALGISVAFSMTEKPGSGSICCFAMNFVVLLPFGVILLVKIVTAFQAGRPARLTLGDTKLQFDPGRARSTSKGVLEFLRNSETAVDRLEIAAVRLDRLGERQRLSIDVGARRIEIGSTLTEPEREWLARALRIWAGLVEEVPFAPPPITDIKRWRM